MRYFTFGGIDSRTHFLTNYIKRPFLPPVTVPTMEIPRKAGVIPLQRNEIGAVEITIGVTIMAVSHVDVRERVRALSAFLIKTTEQDLIISDEIDKKYLARFNQSGNDLEELAYTGAGELTFTCFDPFAYAINEKTQLITGTQMDFINTGTAAVYPKFRVIPTVQSTFIRITNTTTGKKLMYNATWAALDGLIIDTKTNRVYKEADSVNFIKYLTLDSEFFPLEIGSNIIKVENQNADGTGVTGQLRAWWTERFY
jgi:predicted phage tail component-like protein